MQQRLINYEPSAAWQSAHLAYHHEWQPFPYKERHWTEFTCSIIFNAYGIKRFR